LKFSEFHPAKEIKTKMSDLADATPSRPVVKERRPKRKYSPNKYVKQRARKEAKTDIYEEHQQTDGNSSSCESEDIGPTSSSAVVSVGGTLKMQMLKQIQSLAKYHYLDDTFKEILLSFQTNGEKFAECAAEYIDYNNRIDLSVDQRRSLCTRTCTESLQ